MKTNFKYVMMMAAALVLGFSSCSNDDEIDGGGNEVGKGQPTTMSVSIKTPSVPGTYADDVNATDDEIDMQTVAVLIYEKNAMNAYILEQVEALVRADFAAALTSPDTYTSTKQINTTIGDKKIFVGMNLPAGLTLPTVGTNLATLENLVHTMTAKNDLSAANNFVMFSGEAQNVTLVAETTPGTTPTANTLTLPVKRMVAKVTVQDDIARDHNGDIVSQGGWLTNLESALGNSNKTIYPLQKRVGAAPFHIEDANWNGASWNANDYFGIATTDYQALDANNATIDGVGATPILQPMYAPENTADNFRTDGNNLTYISVRAKYVPAFFCDANGASKGANTNATPAVSFWVVTENNGDIKYFDVEADADTYQAATAGSVKSLEYVGGFCYFRAYMNKNATSDLAGAQVAKYDFLRNNYYKAVIKSIKAPGAPVDSGDVKEPTTLIVNVEVEPWALVVENHDL